MGIDHEHVFADSTDPWGDLIDSVRTKDGVSITDPANDAFDSAFVAADAITLSSKFQRTRVAPLMDVVAWNTGHVLAPVPGSTSYSFLDTDADEVLGDMREAASVESIEQITAGGATSTTQEDDSLWPLHHRLTYPAQIRLICTQVNSSTGTQYRRGIL